MGRRTTAIGAGRTDTGVHAIGQGVGFTGSERWAADVTGLRRALNALSPRDGLVERVSPMRPGFHARKNATARRYRYVIGTVDAAGSPFRRPYESALDRSLAMETVARAAAAHPAQHDLLGLAARDAAKAHD